MLLSELKTLLATEPDRALQVKLSDGSGIPESFHVTEVGQVTKTFIDCGGKTRVTTACVIQTWLGSDIDHRLSTKKLAKILTLSENIIPLDGIPLEVEYERGVISQYPVVGARVSGATITLELGTKHTDCLAKELCGTPAPGAIRIGSAGGCC